MYNKVIKISMIIDYSYWQVNYSLDKLCDPHHKTTHSHNDQVNQYFSPCLALIFTIGYYISSLIINKN